MTLEKDIEQKLIKIVERHGGMCLKWVCPGWAGVPDRIILMPGGRVIFVELKRPQAGVISRRQLWWQGKLDKLGFTHWFITDEAALQAADRTLTLLGLGREG